MKAIILTGAFGALALSGAALAQPAGAYGSSRPPMPSSSTGQPQTADPAAPDLSNQWTSPSTPGGSMRAPSDAGIGTSATPRNSPDAATGASAYGSDASGTTGWVNQSGKPSSAPSAGAAGSDASTTAPPDRPR